MQRLPPADRIPFAVAQSAAAADVLLRAVTSSDGTRRSVVQALRRTSLSDGFTGGLRLDRWGDPVTAPVTIFRLGGNAPNATGLPSLEGGAVVATITPPLRAVPPG
jgi:ABC-type branched-subunit amino acid transport system substrate-binding protein